MANARLRNGPCAVVHTTATTSAPSVDGLSFAVCPMTTGTHMPTHVLRRPKLPVHEARSGAGTKFLFANPPAEAPRGHEDRLLELRQRDWVLYLRGCSPRIEGGSLCRTLQGRFHERWSGVGQWYARRFLSRAAYAREFRDRVAHGALVETAANRRSDE